ncbi:MAG: hypothetical protein HKN74_02345 [Acidimicrobiia bacterium]|nr:hypothetical protein [Acidimicrobiia bacterium]NNL69465.1 hypothetical protein [Acidimicrobiia bacterium]
MAIVREQPEIYVAHSRGDGPVVRRSWKLDPSRGEPRLAGLLGFPWPEPIVQAKCTLSRPAGPGDLFGTVRMDRTHRVVPSVGCSCGIYAGDNLRFGWWQRGSLRTAVLVSGFVRLSGRVLEHRGVYRAEEATVIGPLSIAVPAAGRMRRWGRRGGLSQRVARIVTDGDVYRARFGERGPGVPVDDWLRDATAALSQRYGVAVLGSVASE